MEKTADIAGYEGLYTIDTLGRVYSCKRKKYMAPSSLAYGHQVVNLRKNGVSKAHYVHRLVAEAFIPNPDKLPIVHHIDEDPKNNNVENLQWCTQKENVHHCIGAGKFGKMSRKRNK